MDPVAQPNDAFAGRYELDREIGAGGMATGFLARDTRHHRQVALRLLKPELGVVLGAERFLSEIQVTANLQHPNLLPLFDSGEAGGLQSGRRNTEHAGHGVLIESRRPALASTAAFRLLSGVVRGTA